MQLVSSKPSPRQRASGEQSVQPNVVRLAERRVDQQTIRYLQGLLQAAMRGEIAGIVAAVHYGGREYSYLGSGSMCDHPSMGIAAAHRLATKLLQTNG